ncbi:MAG TPA: glutamine--tRNA ligase/YqeY domain fusion protein [Spirochaetota bacterium]|nr:glutamine--tRNA ligase/YqeY domain fusion protein [Spirochaetota bacterium]
MGNKKKQPPASGHNFIRDIIRQDLESGKCQKIITRFPPEPNGYLHIGHAKAVCTDFELAREFGGEYHLRFDDTNPLKEEGEYVEAIKTDIKWLGYDWGKHLYFASDYFDRMYEYALQLIKQGQAYVDDLNAEQIREYRGTLTQPGRESPCRNRSVDENLKLFTRMQEGAFADGEKVLRAKIDMAAPNINMRDPVMYRISHNKHHRTGDQWCIYPMYDWAHGLEDSIEKITHSLCDISFEDHRPLYEWFLEQLGIYKPQQIEFARLNISYTITSKRKLARLVEDGHVSGWDDPRMPTLSGLRRRGVPAAAVREFMRRIGVAKNEGVVEVSMLEYCVREVLNYTAQRRMGVIDPLLLIIDNYPEDKEEYVEAVNNPEDETAGKRKLPFSKVLYIEKADFRIDPPPKFFRLAPGREIRLKFAYYVKCVSYDTDSSGNVTAVHCTYDPASRGGWTEDGRKVKGTSHWVSARHAFTGKILNYDRLFNKEDPARAAPGEDFTANLNPDSLSENNSCKLEPSLKEAAPEQVFQFERLGYYCADSKLSRPGAPVFNRTVTLRDTWAKKNRC